MAIFEAKGLNKSFGKLQAVKDLSFSIPEGSVFGLLGRNGAGKTTTIRMMMNIIGPDSGEILFQGRKIDDAFRRRASYLPEERGLYKKMKVIDLLNFFLELKGIKPDTAKDKTLGYLQRFDLLDRQNAKIEDLSKGNQQKVQLITAIQSDPDLLVLDEPFSGLDPINTDILKDIILDLKQQGKVIIFSTHLMEFAERMCDHIALIQQGELKLDGSLSDIKRRHGQRNVSLVYEGNLAFLRHHPMVEAIHDYGYSTDIRLHRSEDIQTLLKLLVEHDIQVKKFDANDISLQQIFLEVAGDQVTSDENTLNTESGELANV